MIKYILLGLLSYSPMSGYDLKKTIDSSTAHFWHAHHSQIYTTLRELKRGGLVISEIVNEENRPQRRVYSITDAGKESFREWLAAPLRSVSPIKDEFMVRLFFSNQRDTQPVIDELTMQRSMHEDVLASYYFLQKSIPNHEHRKLPDIENESMFWFFTLDMGIRFEKMYIEWLDDVINTIKN